MRDVEELAPSIDWKSVQERKLLSGSNISFPDQQAISSAFERCGEVACAPTSTAEMDAYMTYCNYNPSACGFATYA
ncbi:hypothetical protein KA013_04435 [Patescibacteria group bacterium]|nr:hypothetical protein [Patescibacteria group bacterium]